MTNKISTNIKQNSNYKIQTIPAEAGIQNTSIRFGNIWITSRLPCGIKIFQRNGKIFGVCIFGYSLFGLAKHFKVIVLLCYDSIKWRVKWQEILSQLRTVNLMR